MLQLTTDSLNSIRDIADRIKKGAPDIPSSTELLLNVLMHQMQYIIQLMEDKALKDEILEQKYEMLATSSRDLLEFFTKGQTPDEDTLEKVKALSK